MIDDRDEEDGDGIPVQPFPDTDGSDHAGPEEGVRERKDRCRAGTTEENTGINQIKSDLIPNLGKYSKI